jgi:hypothetical protein
LNSKRSERSNEFEIRKNARLLNQGTRCDSVFDRLPNELLIKIAGLSGSNTFFRAEKHNEAKAAKNFCRPALK